MEYIVYKRFHRQGIDGAFKLQYGTVVSEIEGFLFAADGRRICAATSENGWEHFRQNTPEGAMRQEMLERLYRWYEKTAAVKTSRMKMAGAGKRVLENRLRTASTERLEKIYQEKFGGTPCMQ